MLPLFSSLFAFLGALVLMFFRVQDNVNNETADTSEVVSSKNTRFRFVAAFISAIILLASLLFIFEASHTAIIGISGKAILSTNYFSGFTSIIVAFMMFMTVLSRGNAEKPTCEKKNHVLLLLIEGFSLLLISSQSIVISTIILLIIVILLYLYDSKFDNIHKANSRRAFVFRLIGVVLLLFGCALNNLSQDSVAWAYFFVVGLFILVPMFPFSTFFSDQFSKLSFNRGLLVITFQFVVLFLLINFINTQIPIIASVSNLFSALALLSMFILAFAGIAQLTLFRQFAYTALFFANLAIFLSFTLLNSSNDLIYVKYFILSLPLILSFFWIVIYPLKTADSQGMFKNIAGKLNESKTLKFMFVCAMIFMFGAPLTPVFNSLVNASEAMLKLDYTITILYIPLSTTVLVILMFIAYLLKIYSISETFIKLTKTKNSEISQTESKNMINMSRNFFIIAISLLILILVLSILPVFVFQKLRKDSQNKVNFSDVVCLRYVESNSSEGINEK